MKGGVAISREDKDSMYLEIKNGMRLIARECASF
jgi:hypothetical protein